MTIHGRGYRPLEYTPTATLARLLPIAVREFTSLFRSRWGLFLFIVCQGPAIGSLVLLMIQAGVWKLAGDAGGPPPGVFEGRANPLSPHFYLDPVVRLESFVPFLALTTLVTCRAIAKDRAARALEIYWTRGIGPFGYFAAKWFGSFLLIGVGFVAAPLVLWVLGVLMAPDWSFLEETIGFMPRTLAALVVFTLVLTGIGTGFSALTRSPNLASILWVFLLAGSSVVALLLSRRLFRGDPWLAAVSPWNAMRRIAEWIAGQTPPADYSPWMAVVAVSAVVLPLGIVLARRLRLSEAVA